MPDARKWGEPARTTGALARGLEAFARQAWAEAYAQLAAADQETPLALDDLERLATAGYLAGRDADSAAAWTRAHRECARRGDLPRAARCAFWLALPLLLKGDAAPAGGWLARAQRLLDDCDQECAERGYLLVPAALRSLGGGDPAGAYQNAVQATTIGIRFGDRDLTALGQLGQGQALIALGREGDGVALLDEAMVAVTVGEVSPPAAGIIYCAVIETCQRILDLRRAHEWTDALARWCDAQPGLMPYRGQCLVHRAQIMRLRGAWPDALAEARRACELLDGASAHPAAALAYYELGELYRLRGESAAAAEAYRQASRWGLVPQPGLALLRLTPDRIFSAQDGADAPSTEAMAAMRTALAGARDRAARCHLLAAYAEILLSAGNAAAARTAAGELAELAAQCRAPYLDAVSARAVGAVLLAEGDAGTALTELRRSWQLCQELGAPYEAARTRVLIGLACRRLGDVATAALELDAACQAFRQLEAVPDLEHVEKLRAAPPPGDASGLTARERQVLRLVAAGRRNRDIAADLVISEHTVHRHVQNIFTKLGVSSRTEAAAFAYSRAVIPAPRGEK